MSDNKKYYYLKLKDTFFDSEEMKILESQKNGILYQNIYLKMCLLSVKNNGALTFKDVMPYDVAMLSTILRFDIDSVKTAIDIFIKLGLVVVSANETMYMADIQSLIGQSSTEADRIKEYRNKLKCTNEVQMLQNCTPEIEIEIEIEKDTEKEKDTDINNTHSTECVKKKNSKAPLFDEVDTFTNNLKLREIIKKWLTMILKTSRNYNLEQFKIQLEKLAKIKSDERKIEVVTNNYAKNYRALVYDNQIDKTENEVIHEETEEQKYFKTLINNGVENEKVII